MKKYKYCILLVIVLVTIQSSGAFAATAKACTEQKADEASKEYGSYEQNDWTWHQLYRSFQRYGYCADASNPGIWNAELATVYDEAVEFLLTQKWDTFGDFAMLARTNSSFRRFVISRISEATSANGVTAILKNVRHKCPVKSKSLCHDIEKHINGSEIQ
ncbi:MAG: hypothetical protein EPN97_01195 [Alphaproteobacteria bacterium]|nr:MAG: hypothetical protein EPN97_01195 [Alphaproteobacteria bacterium]